MNGQAAVVLGMEPVETLRILGEFGNPNMVRIVNPRPVYPSGGVSYPDLENVKKEIERLSAKTSYVNATKVALEMGNPILTNIIIIGGAGHRKYSAHRKRGHDADPGSNISRENSGNQYQGL